MNHQVEYATTVLDTISSPAPGRYRVWAPRAATLALEVDGTREPMARDAGGWWTANRDKQFGQRYGFVVDGEGPLPDPRSESQPDGVHGLSRVVDHTQYVWSDAEWQAPPLADAVLYELHVGTFSESGTFLGALDHLAHLVDLGVTHVELMPVVEFPGDRGWGYDGVDLFAPHRAYGSADDLKRLVDGCHAAGLAVLLDVVYNHLGPAGNYLSRFGPYFTHRHTTPWGDAINLEDEGRVEVRRFICDNAIMWLRDYHFDGLRLDAVHALKDSSPRHLLAQMSEEVEALERRTGRDYVLIAESDLNDPRVVQRREDGGYGMDAHWSDDFHHALHAVLTGERSGYYEDFGTLAHLARAWREAYVYAGEHSAHRGRRHGRPAGDLSGWRFVVAAQNHDQVGNRALGERLSQLTSVQRQRIAAALVLTSPFLPLLFQGEEWGASTPFQYFTAHEDEGLGRQVSAGRRGEFAAFGWDPDSIPDPQSPRTFQNSKLCWNERARSPHAEVLSWYRSLIDLRRSHAALRDGRFREAEVSVDEARGTLAIRRGDLCITCNLGRAPARLPMGVRATLILASDDVRVEGTDVWLPPESIAVVSLAGG